MSEGQSTELGIINSIEEDVDRRYDVLVPKMEITNAFDIQQESDLPQRI